MTADDRPLPTPPRTRFGRPVPGDEAASAPLTADRMAQAAAGGFLEDFLQHEIPEGEHARSLAMMMMGLSGMMPPSASSAPPSPAGTDSQAPSPAAIPPEVLADVSQAVSQADIAGMARLLRAEHAKRSGLPAGDDAPGAAREPAAAAATVGAVPPQIDAAIVDELIRIAADNQVTVDWLVLRAIKLYVEEHRKTGRL